MLIIEVPTRPSRHVDRAIIEVVDGIERLRHKYGPGQLVQPGKLSSRCPSRNKSAATTVARRINTAIGGGIKALNAAKDSRRSKRVDGGPQLVSATVVLRQEDWSSPDLCASRYERIG